jgi:hypothetical protein
MLRVLCVLQDRAHGLGIKIADCSILVRNCSYCSCSLRKQYHVPVYNLASTFFKLFIEHPVGTGTARLDLAQPEHGEQA